MELTQQCPKEECGYSGNEHGLKTHLALSHEESKYGKVELSCDNCKEDFSRAQWKISSGKTFCSRECKNNFNKEERECVVCGDTKVVDKSSYEHKHGWVCSKECNKNQYREKVECVVCGEERIEFKKEERKFPYRCSKECTEEWVKVETDCSYCGNPYIEDRHSLSRYDKTYCSDECFYDSQKSVNSDKVNHRKWAIKVKEEADYVCFDCGESYDVMCAHHSPPKEELSKKEQTNPENGVCLCYPCHSNKHEEPQSKLIRAWWNWYNE